MVTYIKISVQCLTRQQQRIYTPGRQRYEGTIVLGFERSICHTKFSSHVNHIELGKIDNILRSTEAMSDILKMASAQSTDLAEKLIKRVRELQLEIEKPEDLAGLIRMPWSLRLIAGEPSLSSRLTDNSSKTGIFSLSPDTLISERPAGDAQYPGRSALTPAGISPCVKIFA